MKLIIPTAMSEKNNGKIYPVAMDQAEMVTIYDRSTESFNNVELSKISGKNLSEKLISVFKNSKQPLSFVSNQPTNIENFSEILQNYGIDHWISTGTTVKEIVSIFELGGAFLF